MKENQTISDYIIDNHLILEKLVNDFSKYICTIVNNMTNNYFNTEDLEEIVSDVLLGVWKNKDRIENNVPLRAYISGITKNIVKNRLRNIKNYKMVYLDDESQNIDIKSNIDLEETIEMTEEMQVLEKTLNHFDKESQKIFKMFYFESLKIKEISRNLGITEFNVATKLHRIRKKLKKDLERMGYKYE